MPPTRRPHRASLPSLIVTSILSAMLVFAIGAVSSPGEVLGATISKTAMCGANLRTSTSTSARVRKLVTTGTRVSVAASVTGGSWRTTCAGKAVSGRSWYRVSAIGGKSVKSLFGVSYLYAATGLFKTTTITRYAGCRANLRTSAASSAPAKTIVALNTKVLVTTSVAGSSYSTTCSGKKVSGNRWYRISSVSGKTVKSLYGVSYLYTASLLFTPSPTTVAASTPSPTAGSTVAPENVPTPTPKPSATPTAAPTPTPAPTAAPTAAPTPTPTPTPSPFANMTEGIDISHWQNTIDWPKVAAAGKKFAFMKASESTDYTDPTYAWNRQQARAAGLYVGAYHFAQPSTGAGDAVAEADHFLITATPVSGDLLPVLDLERSGGLSQTALTAWVKAYVERIHERLGVRAIIYVSPNFWKTYMADTTWFGLNGYDILWVAHWTSATAPLVPGQNWGGGGWTFWQYSSDGSVPGISGRVDLNRYRFSKFDKVRIP